MNLGCNPVGAERLSCSRCGIKCNIPFMLILMFWNRCTFSVKLTTKSPQHWASHWPEPLGCPLCPLSFDLSFFNNSHNLSIQWRCWCAHESPDVLFASGWTGPADGGHLSTSCPCAACITATMLPPLLGLEDSPGVHCSWLTGQMPGCWDPPGPCAQDYTAVEMLAMLNEVPL